MFLIHLIQDVNILRPLVFMATRDFKFDALLLVSTKFIARDGFGIWRNELDSICLESGAQLQFFEDDWEAHRQLTGQGLLFAASESHLHNHATTHNVMRMAPPSYLRVTLQHGFECVGFRHSVDHVRAHGETAAFGADFVCSWFDRSALTSMAPSQTGKLLVTGPTSVLQMPSDAFERKARAPGLVCENLHSVRLNGARNLKTEFVEAFGQFCQKMSARKRSVALRPHPGGQYSLKNKVPLPFNVDIENAPLYRLDLRQFSYGISAPSSVLIDMLLAEIPTAVWRDHSGSMDAKSYEGLTTVSSPSEWARFARSAERNSEPYLAIQRKFLQRQGMILDPAEVFRRFASLFQAAARIEVREPASVAERERILFVANGNVPTLQLSFDKPLSSLVSKGEIATRFVSEQRLRELSGVRPEPADGADCVDRYLDDYNPSAIVFCRYSGPCYKPVVAWAHRASVPIIYHIDDDLLAVPAEIGARKSAFHNAPDRLATVRDLLNSADLVYASTEKLKDRLLEYFPDLPILAGKIYCSGSVLRSPNPRPECTVGYMASADHEHNLQLVLPAIERLLDMNPQVKFELFGSISAPERLIRFGDRVRAAPPIADYDTFLEKFCERQWDIGICPLVPIPFNMMKANTKWVEYTAAGVAVVASRGTVYDDCCADGCGTLAQDTQEWFVALDQLVHNVELRVATVRRAQEKLERGYSLAALRSQVLNVFARAHEARTDPSHSCQSNEDAKACHTV